MIGSTVFITGAASGIGFAVAEACVAAGASVLMADKDAAPLEQQAARLGAAAAPIPLDVTDEVAAARCLSTYHGRLAGVVNSAGIGAGCAALATDSALLRRLLEVSLVGTFLVSREAVRAMPPEGGAIVNITSVSGLRGNIGRAAYGASKGGVEMLSKVMATELGNRNIRVNTVAPGPVDTPMTQLHHSAEIRRSWEQSVPMERYAVPREVASAVLFLLDPARSGFVNGQTLCVDGGFTAAGISPALAQAAHEVSPSAVLTEGDAP